MNQIYHDASLAMSAAYELSKRRHKIAYRHMCLDEKGNTVWIVSLEKDPVIALQALYN